MADLSGQMAMYLARLLKESTTHSSSSGESEQPLTVPESRRGPDWHDYFTACSQPACSLEAYCVRLVKHSNCSDESLVMALAYVSRAAESGFPISNWTVHRLVFTAVVVASKFHDDYRCHQRHFAFVGGVAVRDLNQMELFFLSHVIRFRAVVGVEEYRRVRSQLSAVQRVPVLALAADIRPCEGESRRHFSSGDGLQATVASGSSNSLCDLGLSSSQLERSPGALQRPALTARRGTPASSKARLLSYDEI
jgi:hypothetical protein